MNGADSLVKCMEMEGTEVLFGYPGVAICPFFDSLRKSSIKPILVRQEQNAAHAASGYARMTGKAGVCVVTSGPGATNLITGIATAYADSIPLICITGQVQSELIGSDVFQEADITGAVESFVKYSYLVRDVNDLPRIMKEAYFIATSGRKGPVLIDIPSDIQTATLPSFVYPDSIHMRTYKPTVEGNVVQVKKVIKELLRAEKPLICAGGGVFLSDAVSEIREFASLHQIPVVSTMMGIGVLPTNDPLYFGMVGNNGRPYANRAINECDLLLMIGARVADRAVNRPELIRTGKVLVHIDVDPAEIGKNVGPTIPLVGDIAHIFREMLKRAPEEEKHDPWLSSLNKWKEEMREKCVVVKEEFIPSKELMKALSREVDTGAILCVDVGQNQIWATHYYEVAPEGRLLTSGGMGTMGYALPAAIGAKLACPDRQVLALCGEGGFQMTMNELGCAKQYDIPVKIVLLRNNVLGMVHEYQYRAYKGHYTMVDLGEGPDFSKIAEAYGMSFSHLDGHSSLPDGIRAFLNEEKSGILEVWMDPDDRVLV